MKENSSESTGIPGIILVKENDQRPLPSPHVQATSDELEALPSGMLCMHQVSRAIRHGNNS
jgi:hypothetical protein